MVEVGPSGFNRNYTGYFTGQRDQQIHIDSHCQQDYCTLYYQTEEAPIDLSKQSNWTNQHQNLNGIKEEKVEVIILPNNDWTQRNFSQETSSEQDNDDDDDDDTHLIIDLKTEPDNEETRNNSYIHHTEQHKAEEINGSYDHHMEENRYEGNANQMEMVKAMRRKEQNKRAAMIYRIRQKSFCELADQEYEQLMTKNRKLKEQLTNLTQQVAYTRNMIDLSVAATKQQLKMEMDLQHQGDSFSECASAPQMSDFTPVKRPRNNSWPQTRVVSNEKKKEQNKLASKRFRERKKQQMEQVKEEEGLLELRNKELKDKQREMETTILSLKHLLAKRKLI